MADTRVRRRVVVRGRVQGVFFRGTIAQAASRTRVEGWVRNLADGNVEAVFEGEPAAVEALVALARQGPQYAQVAGLDVYEESPEGERGFQVRP